MPDKRQWSSALAAGLANLAGRLEDRHTAVTAREAAHHRAAVGDEPAAEPVAAAAPEPAHSAPQAPAAPAPATPVVPAQRSAPPTDPLAVVPWSMRVAAEIGWRLLILAGTVWVLMRVIGAVRLVVLAFAAALLITALLQPFVARLKRLGVPRGLATAMVFVGGFIVMGLVGWFVVWQVMDNIDNLSSSLQDGIAEGKKWLLNSPFHVTDDQINQVAKNLSDAIGSNTKALTDAGLEGVTVIVEVLTGVLLAMFSTLFLLYDGPNIWNWVLRLFPEAAREGLAGAGPRAWRTLTLYVRGTVIVALIDAICIGIGIFFLGVPMAVPLAVVIFLSSFIPLVGAVASGFIAVVVALVTEGPFTALLVLAVVLAVQQIEGHILQPFILGRAVRVHPLAVVLSVAAGSMVAGIGGAVVAVPLVAVSNTVVGYLRAYSREKADPPAAYVPEPAADRAAGPDPSPATDQAGQTDQADQADQAGQTDQAGQGGQAADPDPAQDPAPDPA
ncbi:AI-2E family transporter [Streptomyces cocklensis]|uniref:Predicted PurR-regulated permease PerM n=1 Tax=Actinacidiphila cocklensis TaxID=887465 RepID=A0A9W4GQZ1_9ACTN|nr:AI-2E family transporter [Actinacidiphila cocklensis]MDD1062869.1 AI-2E family transporter [Actinacidiphila cocklensis]CAG6394129.1 Predicted PurR-regulated permease PerM [Actinacidiphila cocklensis]